MFAVYDGHGGDLCCNFMKEAFHNYLLEEFKTNDTENHITQACLKFDQDFVQKVKQEMPGNTSGSCALALLILGNYFIKC